MTRAAFTASELRAAALDVDKIAALVEAAVISETHLGYTSEITAAFRAAGGEVG